MANCRTTLVCIAAVLWAAVARSQDVPADPQLPDRKEWLAARTQEFASYRIEVESTPRCMLAMEPKPLLVWSNPERNTFFGATFVWAVDGRPEMIGSAYGRGKFMRHEFHSLSTEPLVARRLDNQVHRFQPGIAWRELAGAPAPAATYTSRLAQMRRQAERFQVTLIFRRPTEVQHPLRMLPQPVYRSPESTVAEVAVFLFVQGTDPECVLLVEARADKAWRYAFARQNAASLVAQLDGEQVLDLPSLIGPQDADAAYVTVTPPEAKAAP